jgi:Flp pilus assembly protein TadG
MRNNGRNPNDLPRRSAARRGTAAVELLLVLPILLSLLLGMFELSMFLAARQQVTTASREGARVAALGGTPDEVQQAVQLFLGSGNLSNANVQVTLIGQNGVPAATGDAVQVVVTLPLNQAIPDLLAFIGVSIQNQSIVAGTVMRKE